MSLTFSDRAPQPKSYVGIGFVVVVHLAAIYALSAGLIKTPPRAPENITLKPLPPEVPEIPLPQDPVRPTEPVMRDVKIAIPEPTVPVIAPSDPVISGTVVRDPVPATDGPTMGTGQTIAIATSKPDTGIKAPGAVCSVMPKPEVPAVNWVGEAVLQVIATVRGGRVVGTDFKVAQGALDSKTKRSLQRSVESALSGYQCQGDATFQQDFAFRID
ncbi:hypothetical protein ACS5PN_00225 [Roseateles sp. NT4]|uniref:hypothetical protein n=1 Tax=Roseateles sp. NT4 TaxID=3453715 RepID=UPI003EECD5AF